jgi:hypothetical protein
MCFTCLQLESTLHILLPTQPSLAPRAGQHGAQPVETDSSEVINEMIEGVRKVGWGTQPLATPLEGGPPGALPCRGWAPSARKHSAS